MDHLFPWYLVNYNDTMVCISGNDRKVVNRLCAMTVECFSSEDIYDSVRKHALHSIGIREVNEEWKVVLSRYCYSF